VENGGASWTSASRATMPGDPTPSLVVRLRPPDGQVVPTPMVEALIASAKPAHVPHRLEVVAR
jgi:hypothetical protein